MQRGNLEQGYDARERNPIRIRKQVGGVGFVIAMRMSEERGVYCNAVGMWVKLGGETYRER